MPNSQRWNASHLLLDSHGRNQLQAKRNGFTESAYGPGWRIGNIAVIKTTASWLGDLTSKIIPISVWLSER